MYSEPLSFSTPLVRCTHMWFNRACWRRLHNTGDWALYYCMLLIYVHNFHVSRNVCWKSLVRYCEVAPVLVQLLPGESGCCGWLFVLPILFILSAYIWAVDASVACWSLSGGRYWIHNLWLNWLLGLVGRLSRWLELYLVPGSRLVPGVGKEMAVQTCVRQCCWKVCIDDSLHLPLWVRRFPRARGGLCKNSLIPWW